MPHRPRKRFGQHFLQDPNIITRIIAAIRPTTEHRLVEIGPGLGALTRPLLAAVGELDVVELDRDVLEPLQRYCAGAGILRIHNTDVLTFDFAALRGSGSRLQLVGNLPYSISTPLLFYLLTHAVHIDSLHFMLQKDVVDRIVAAPGEKAYGRLSVMLQYRCYVNALFTVGPEAFYPPPKVWSSVVRIVPRETSAVEVQNEGHFAEIVKRSFAQRRKILRNSLHGLLDVKHIQAAGVDPGARPEKLDLAAFAALSNQL
ncbi:MAG: 16S rRNA (adenine(1518)-N(6)/adenine(1519)-N(6))-dimethyltransferase [Candidatus Contendobacter odensis]|uniref:Ribosomal RNA small subunit methyltransferase A n=1 Tax=Candidatus Contendibacter odensensis TaxID=1400860 RepID=A0A2G6PGS7_9GAMM|nr:MAG: 16S rRNA (adenine(1518)-N(6)/adenine(1519)-N(6))-dimethyltransferase [Candidatus Contendobacter odensis]